MSAAESEEAKLLSRVAAGDRAAVDRLFDLHRDRLRWMIRLRLNRRLQGRVDPSDVLQEACLEASRRLDEYVREPRLPFFLWLRHLTALKLLALHRQHLRTGVRDANREARPGEWPGVDSAALAAEVVGNVTSPSVGAMRAEAQAAVQSALEAMDPTDREVLVLRHFEALSNDEVARLLDLTKTAASNRYVRALKRLRKILEAVPGLLEGAEGL